MAPSFLQVKLHVPAVPAAAAAWAGPSAAAAWAGLQMHLPNLPPIAMGQRQGSGGEQALPPHASLHSGAVAVCQAAAAAAALAGQCFQLYQHPQASAARPAQLLLTNSCEPSLLAIHSCCRCHTVTQCRHTILLLEHYVTLCHAMSHIDTSSYLESVTLHLCQH